MYPNNKSVIYQHSVSPIPRLRFSSPVKWHAAIEPSRVREIEQTDWLRRTLSPHIGYANHGNFDPRTYSRDIQLHLQRICPCVRLTRDFGHHIRTTGKRTLCAFMNAQRRRILFFNPTVISDFGFDGHCRVVSHDGYLRICLTKGDHAARRRCENDIGNLRRRNESTYTLWTCGDYSLNFARHRLRIRKPRDQ